YIHRHSSAFTFLVQKTGLALSVQIARLRQIVDYGQSASHMKDKAVWLSRSSSSRPMRLSQYVSALPACRHSRNLRVYSCRSYSSVTPMAPCTAWLMSATMAAASLVLALPTAASKGWGLQ